MDNNKEADKCHPECEAWRQVAVDSNKAVDAYIREIHPDLGEYYGMPVDGVRRAFKHIQSENKRLLAARQSLVYELSEFVAYLRQREDHDSIVPAGHFREADEMISKWKDPGV